MSLVIVSKIACQRIFVLSDPGVPRTFVEDCRLVSSLLYGTRVMLVSNCRLSKTKNTHLMTISMETVRMAKSRPRKNQSERPDLPQDYLAI